MKIIDKLQKLSKDPDTLDKKELKEMKTFIFSSTIIFMIIVIYLNNLLNNILFN